MSIAWPPVVGQGPQLGVNGRGDGADLVAGRVGPVAAIRLADEIVAGRHSAASGASISGAVRRARGIAVASDDAVLDVDRASELGVETAAVAAASTIEISGVIRDGDVVEVCGTAIV